MPTYRLAFLVSAALVATPAFALFEQFDQLKNEFSADDASVIEELLLELEVDSATSIRFSDVPSDAWFSSYVSVLATSGIVSGDKDANGNLKGTYRPADGVTVAEVLKIALKSAGVNEAACKGTPKHPNAKNHWSKQFVLCAEQRQVRLLNGNPSLDRKATRAEVVGLLDDVFSEEVPQLLSNFKDTVGHPYEKDIAYNATFEIVSGDTDASGKAKGTFRPDDSINRAEIAKVVVRKLVVISGN